MMAFKINKKVLIFHHTFTLFNCQIQILLYIKLLNRMDLKSLQLFKMLECGDIALSLFKPQAIFLLGMTKRGKTTSGHMLCNQPLRKKAGNSSMTILEPAGINFLNAQIGQSHDSCTQIPNYFETMLNNKKCVIIDCPGYEDTYGCHRMISNGYFRYRVFSKVENAKFVLVVQYTDLQNDIAGLKNTIMSFMQTFKNYDQIEQDLLKSTAMLVTKVPRDNTIQDIQSIIIDIIKKYDAKSISQKKKFFFKNLLRNMVKHKKLFKYDEVTQNYLITDTQNTVLTDIDKALTFWKRDVLPNGTVNMENIQFNILDQVNKNKSNLDYWGQFVRLLNTLQNKFKSAFVKGVETTFNTIIQDCKKDEQSRRFMDIITSIVEQHYHFDPKFDQQRNQLRRKMFTEQIMNQNQIKNYQIRKFKIGGLIQNVSKQIKLKIETLKPEELRSQKFINFVQEEVMKVLRHIRILSIKRQQIERIITKYCYVLFRMIEQLKIFFILLNKPPSIAQLVNANANGIMKTVDLARNYLNQFPQFIVPMRDNFSVIQTVGLKQAKKKFVLGYKDKKNLDQYAEIKLFIQEVQKENQLQINVLKLKQIQLEITKMLKFNISSAKPEDLLKQINNMDKNRLFLEKFLYENPEQKTQENDLIIQSILDIMKIMGEIFQFCRNLQCALICFNSISNVHKVIQIYELMIETNKQLSQKRQILIKIAQYAMRHCKLEYAITKLQYAYSLSRSIKDIKQVSDLIIDYSTMQPGFQAQFYILNMIKNGFYKPLTAQQNKKIQNFNLDNIKKGFQLKKNQIKSTKSQTFIN